MDIRHFVAHGPRVSLGWFLPGDFEAVHSFASDPRVCKFLSWGPNTPVDTHRFLAERSTPRADDYQLAVVAGGSVIGSAAVWVTDAGSSTGELGYALTAESWGQGYATEVATLLLEVGWERLGLARIAATCDIENGASARVLEKVGMLREGTLRSLRVVRGARRDHHLYARVAGYC